MKPQLVSLKSKSAAPPILKTPTNVESNPTYSDKTSFPTIARDDDWPVKRQLEEEPEDDDRKSESAPVVHIHRSPTVTRRTQRGSSESTTRRTRPPRVSRDFEAKFHALEKRQKTLIEQTKLDGQFEYLAVSKSSSGQFWITVEGTGNPFIRQPFTTAEFCFECALELEDKFDILQVIGLRAGETMERIEEIVGVWLDRERVSRVWGWSSEV